MARIPRPLTTTKSEHWLRVLVNDKPDILNNSIDPLGKTKFQWVSPMKFDHYAEYRDQEFLNQLRIGQQISVPLNSFWPSGGPRWDGLGIGSKKKVFLIEAKAYVDEIDLNPSNATKPKSIQLIKKSLAELKTYLNSNCPYCWFSLFYQFNNRLATLYFLRILNKINAHLVFIYFLNAPDVAKPATKENWVGALQFQKRILNVQKHPLKKFIYEIFIDASTL